MTRARAMAPLAILLLAALAASCSTLGADRPPQPPPPSSGAGPFRPVRAEELGNESGAALVTPAGTAVPAESAMMAGDHLFYATGSPSAIHRSGPKELPPYEAGPVLLTATAAWEGTAVFDPWAVTRDDGTTLLYYAADGGIGLAEAPSAGGSFARVDQLLAADPTVEGGAVPRRPSVVSVEGGGWRMYYEVGGAIAVASSPDGRAFTHEMVLDLAPPGDPTPVPEVGLGAPGAAVAVSPAGRRITRLYFTSFLEDGTTVLGFAASLDGFVFERAEVPPVQMGNPAFPSPVLLEDPITLLLYQADLDLGRGIAAGLAPGSADYPSATE